MNMIVSLKDVSEQIDYGLTTSASTDEVGPKFLRITDIDGSHVDWGSVPYCNASPSEYQKYALLNEDIVIARTGASTGRSQWVRVNGPAVFASYLVRIRVRPTFDSRFISYVLASKQWQDFVSSVAHGKSAQPNMSAGAMAEFQFACPPLPIQRAITEVLGALDDKIAANTKLANIADEWIRAEYDLLTTLSSEHRALSEIVIHRRNTANPEMLEAKVPYVGLEHIPRRLMWLGDHGTSDEVSSNKSHFKSGDILFGKLRPYFHKIVTAPKAGICSTDVLVLTPIDEALSGFALASLAHDGVVQAVTSASEGTRMPRTSWKDLSSINVPWPGQEAAASFSTRVSAIRAYVIGLMADNRTLADARDALLPQLMSGKLRVKDAEALVESVV